MSNLKEIAADFCGFVLHKLDITPPSKIRLVRERMKDFETYAYYNSKDDSVNIYVKNRGTADVLRSIAHELIHHKQKLKGELKNEKEIPDVGGPIEDEANAVAGQLIKTYGKMESKKKFNIYS